MSSYRELLTKGRILLEEAQVPDAGLDAWYLLEYVLCRDRSWYFLHENEEASPEVEAEYRSLLCRRQMRIPLQQITGKAYFMGLEFQVNEHVLLPRQDTEILVEEAEKRLRPGDNILDLCTGSGCILLSLLYNKDKVTGVGADISNEALKVARVNAGRLGISAEFVQSDLFQRVEGSFDLIVSNPPYIPADDISGLMEEVSKYEPHLALDGGKDGLDFYRRILAEAGSYLNPAGWLLMEMGFQQGDDLRSMMESAGYEQIEVVRDLAGLNRVILGKRH